MATKPDPCLVDDDNPELDAAAIARARPASEVLPKALFEELTRRSAPEGEMVTLRLDRDVVERFRSTGPNWRERINDALRKASGQ